MLFSTKAEYGVRLMVELGRQAGERPVALASARRRRDACRSPTSSTWSRSCARPAWSARSAAPTAATAWRCRPTEIRMLEVVEALEGPIAPMECFHRRRRGQGPLLARVRRRRAPARPSCSGPGSRAAITKALAGTTLAELVEFESRDSDEPNENRRGRRRLSAAAPQPPKPNWSQIG